MAQQSDLTVRLYQRENIQLPVEFVVSEDHREQVRFTPNSTATSRHTILGTAIDVSRGGMGMMVGEFLPRMCEGVIRVFRQGTGGMSEEARGEPLIEAPVKVRRVLLTSHDPTYSVGMSFYNPQPDLGERMIELMNELMGTTDDPPAGGADA